MANRYTIILLNSRIIPIRVTGVLFISSSFIRSVVYIWPVMFSIMRGSGRVQVLNMLHETHWPKPVLD